MSEPDPHAMILAQPQGSAPAGRLAGLKTLLSALGTETGALPALDGRHPFRPAGSDRAWILIDGAIDLFYRHVTPDDRPGRRRHLMTLEAAELLVGFHQADQAVPLIAIPRADTRVLEVDLRALVSAARDPIAVSALAGAIDTWLRRLMSAQQLPTAPARTQTLQSQPVIDVASGQCIQATGSQTLWVTGIASPALAWGQTPLDAKGLRAIPLAGPLWIEATASEEWRLHRTQDQLSPEQASPLAESLAAFQRFALDRIRYVAERETDRERRRASDASANAGQQLHQGLSALASVFRRGWRPPHAKSSHPLIATAQVAAGLLGLPVPTEDALAPALPSADPLLAMARRAGFSVRSVTLAGEWWTDDHGPLIATHAQGGDPLVLRPTRSKGYEAIDPLSSEIRRVDAALASSLSPQARTLYQPLPAADLTPGRILALGLRGSFRDGLLAVALLLAIGLLSLATPVLTGWILDPVIPQAELGQLATLVAALLIAGLAQQSFTLVQSLLLLRMEGRAANVVQSAVWDRLLALPAAFFHRYSAGDLANRAMSIDAMRQSLSTATLGALTHSIIGVFSFALMLYYDWKLAVGAALVVGVYALIAIVGGRWILHLNREQLRLGGQLQGMVLQLLGAVGKLRTTGSEAQAFGRWAQLYSHLQSNAYDQQVINNRLVVLKSAFQTFATFTIILVVAWQGQELLAFYHAPQSWSDIDSLRLQTQMPTARFVAFYAAFGQFLGAAFGLSEQIIQLANIPAYYERVAPILAASPESTEGIEPQDIRGDIAVHDVHFRYSADTPLVLRGVSLEAKPGELVAVVGPSGAGKSSLVRLLLGFDAPELGSIYLDGQDIASLDKRSMRQHFGVVLQNGRLLAGTLLQNIAAGALLSRDDAMEAARLAGLDKDIAAMPMGLDTYLSEGATTLSGGQRQRLMIARAIVRRPRVIIFDEATSALDNLTQTTVTRSLEQLSSTRIVIAHRLSTIAHADRIYVIDQGRVVETGDFQSLLDLGGLFASLARRQLV